MILIVTPILYENIIEWDGLTANNEETTKIEKEEVKKSIKETIIKHDKGLTMADLESWDCGDGTVDFTAYITNKTERNVTLDILDSWNNIVVPDIEIEGEKVSDEITIGTEILLTA